jgi:organic hydroperoxide reductase OsmC/OhrA
MKKEHKYSGAITWTGNRGDGTKRYNSYDRSYDVVFAEKVNIKGSSDPAFLGDPSRHNPEELLVASISSCHMLWYLHLCSENKVNVISYADSATGTMIENEDGSGYFQEVVLHPEIAVSDESMIETARQLHHRANKMCFIANSCNFPIYHEPVFHVVKPAN